MRRNYNTLLRLSLATSIAIGTTACGGSSNESGQTACIGLDFASPKGGPGAIQMRVFPKFNQNFGDARPISVTGKVLSGNDAGELILAPPDTSGYGQFTFSWDTQTAEQQSSVVHADATYEGKKYPCTDTTLHFDPSNNNVMPHLPNSPY